MPRWKSSQNLLNVKNDGEVFDENWMNFDSISQYAPPHPKWNSERPIKFEDVDIWEVILENGGPFGVYAAWCPYEEFYIVMQNWSIVAEFSGWNANGRLEEYLIQLGVSYPKSPDTEIAPFESKIFVAPIAKEINFV
jgi:hypothetical protein